MSKACKTCRLSMSLARSIMWLCSLTRFCSSRCLLRSSGCSYRCSAQTFLAWNGIMQHKQVSSKTPGKKERKKKKRGGKEITYPFEDSHSFLVHPVVPQSFGGQLPRMHHRAQAC